MLSNKAFWDFGTTAICVDDTLWLQMHPVAKALQPRKLA